MKRVMRLDPLLMLALAARTTHVVVCDLRVSGPMYG